MGSAWSKKIVIADATGGSLLHAQDVLLLKQMDVDIEQISYHQNEDLVKLKGKGFGEGELIKFALENSMLLKTEDNFFKCTGKVYCRNFEVLLQMIRENKLQNIFWRFLNEDGALQRWADTRFFYTTKKFCEEYLIPAYFNVDDRKTSAETCCFDMLNQRLQMAKAIRPLLTGFCGGTNKPYFDSSLGVLDTSCPCWIGK